MPLLDIFGEVRDELNHRSSVDSERRRRHVRSVIQSVTKTYVLITTNVLSYMWSHETLVHSSRVIYELHRRRESNCFEVEVQSFSNQAVIRGLHADHILKLVPTLS